MLEEILNNLKKYGEEDCLQINEKVYKYKDLYQYVCNIYEYVIKENSERKPIVVYGHKDIYMIATFLACSFAGIAYIPIDETIPKKRQENIAKQIDSKFIIDKNIEKIMKKNEYKEIEHIYMKEDDIYYIIFTSGSTGEPKGVKITYRNLHSCINWLKEVCNVSKGVILNQANFSFDLSVADIYLSLTTRSKHYILERKVQKDYKILFENLKKSNATLAVLTPSFADLLLLDKSFNEKQMPNLKQILFCGEKLNKKTVTKIYERFPEIDIINSYGPTECTFAVTSIHLSKENIKDENISLGINKQDTEIYIVNEQLEVLQEKTVGEILIAGESVGEGYIGSNKNNDKFIIYQGKRAYLTGDLGYIENGQLYYVGRKDTQIKYKGYRIELFEIEKALYKLEYIEKAVVTTKNDKEGKVSKIIAFVMLKNEMNKSEYEIKKYIEKELPEYMLPIIKVVHQIPLNSNGKCDQKKLLEEYFK